MAIEIDSELGEKEWDKEAENTDDIIGMIEQSVKGQHLSGQRSALRDAHPKAHGCVRAMFKIHENLEPKLAQGVFVPGKIYQAVIRFSNGDPDPMREDSEPDARGMAIKLFGVPGEKILPDERNAMTQDFVMIDYPVFFLNDPYHYKKLQIALTKQGTLPRVVKALSAYHPKIDVCFKRILLSLSRIPKPVVDLVIATTCETKRGGKRKIRSPLTTQYWSMSAYRLGDPPDKQAVRFTAVPSKFADTIPAKEDKAQLSRNYLRETMQEQLRENDYTFDFKLQSKGDKESVEDNMQEWMGRYHSVATITIPKQEFATLERDQFCDSLSFTPWHALPQHRPLGGVNRMRLRAYEAVSKLRHELNGTQRREPTERDVP